jgi:hypothetical protein
MRNQTIFSSTGLTAGATPTYGSSVAVKPATNPQSVMIPVEINCNSTTPVVTVQGKLTETAAWSDLTSTVSGTIQLIPRCHFYRVGYVNAAGGETLTVTVALL